MTELCPVVVFGPIKMNSVGKPWTIVPAPIKLGQSEGDHEQGNPRERHTVVGTGVGLFETIRQRLSFAVEDAQREQD